MDGPLEQPTITHGEPNPEDDRIGVLIDTPYNADFVEELKSAVPARERSWSPGEKVWWIEPDWASEVEDLVHYHFGGVRVRDEAGNERYRDGSGEYAQEGLF